MLQCTFDAVGKISAPAWRRQTGRSDQGGTDWLEYVGPARQGKGIGVSRARDNVMLSTCQAVVLCVVEDCSTVEDEAVRVAWDAASQLDRYAEAEEVECGEVRRPVRSLDPFP